MQAAEFALVLAYRPAAAQANSCWCLLLRYCWKDAFISFFSAAPEGIAIAEQHALCMLTQLLSVSTDAAAGNADEPFEAKPEQ